MLDARKVLEEYEGVFVDRDCLFVSTTGKLLTGYVNCEVIYPYYDVVNDLVGQLIAPFLEAVEGFVCPATGDIVLAQYATRIANELGHPTTAVWADKHGSDNSYHIERNGFEAAIQGRRVLVLNDRISQGGTTRKVIAEARRLGCDVLGVATIAGVASITPGLLDVPKMYALSTINVVAFSPDEVPEEFRSLPIAVDKALGHGADYQTEHPDYEGGYVKLLHTA
jgi:orotate phosphoribosyltransferase